MHFHISKGGIKTGPCRLEDLRDYLAYGSLRETDLVMREGDGQWIAVGLVPELREMAAGGDIRRVMRYQQIEDVPPPLRSRSVVSRLVLGFLIPPLLWMTAATVFSSPVYTEQKDASGFLTLWPASRKRVVAALIVINLIVWGGAIFWLVRSGVLRDVMTLFKR
jgi:hypothetical protein